MSAQQTSPRLVRIRAVCWVLALTLTLLSACTTQDGYRTAQGWQRQQCQKLQDRDERTRCEKQAELSYEKYRSQTEAAKVSP